MSNGFDITCQGAITEVQFGNISEVQDTLKNEKEELARMYPPFREQLLRSKLDIWHTYSELSDVPIMYLMFFKSAVL